MAYIPQSDWVSIINSTATPLAAGASFPGSFEKVGTSNSITVAVKTDQDGYYQIIYSPDGINEDSPLTRYYRTNQIEAPHRFTSARDYVKVIFTNSSSSPQTYLRLQTIIGDKSDLNAPLDSVLAQDFDATVTRPTDYHTEVALGLRQGVELWNKFGYNEDISVGTEVVASWGGTFTPLTTPTTMTIVSTSANDTGGGSGVETIIVYYIDENRDKQLLIVPMTGTTPIITTELSLGVNRIAMFLVGSGTVNAGTINITATTGGSQMAQMPAGGGVTQQCIFHIPRKHNFNAEWLWANAVKPSGQNPLVTIKMWVYSAISNGKQEVYRKTLDTAVTTELDENPNLPFPITESTVTWIEATTDKNATIVEGRFSGELIRQVDA